MGDLISRKRLLEHIEQWLKANSGGETRTEYAVIDSCYRMVQNLPTAYDVEAVVRELEELKQEKTLGSHKVMIKEAIEIVKGGRNE